MCKFALIVTHNTIDNNYRVFYAWLCMTVLDLNAADSQFETTYYLQNKT